MPNIGAGAGLVAPPRLRPACIDLDDAPVPLGVLVDQALAGEEILIVRAGQPVARLVALRRPERQPGGWQGQVHIRDDFDDPLPDDLLDAFAGKG